MPDVSNAFSTAPNMIFEARNLTVAAGTRTLLRDVNLALRPSEVVALRGPSGSGKTTLLRALCGLDDCAVGALSFNGHAPQELGFAAFRRCVTFVEQRPVMFDCSVEANLRRPFAYRSA